MHALPSVPIVHIISKINDCFSSLSFYMYSRFSRLILKVGEGTMVLYGFAAKFEDLDYTM